MSDEQQSGGGRAGGRAREVTDNSATPVRPGVAPPGVEVPTPTERGRAVSQERPGSSQATAPPSATSGSEGPSEAGRKLLVADLPLDARPEDVNEYFSTFGEIEKVRLQKEIHQKTGERLLFAVVIFKESSSLDNAMKSRNHVIQGNQVRCVRLNRGALDLDQGMGAPAITGRDRSPSPQPTIMKRFQCQHGPCTAMLKPAQQLTNSCYMSIYLKEGQVGCHKIFCGRHTPPDEHHCPHNATRIAYGKVQCPVCLTVYLDHDMVPCNAGHLCCKSCVTDSVKVALGEGRTVISCLGHCEDEINTRLLHLALPHDVLSNLIRQRQAELQLAQNPNLAACPFCPYTTIMEDKNTLMVCKNPDCGKQSCRLCKKKNHEPNSCSVVDLRKQHEEALTAAAVHKCAACSTSFLKVKRTCNKIFCTRCRSTQCVVCKKVVSKGGQGYKHFFPQGGKASAKEPCPLWPPAPKKIKVEGTEDPAQEKDSPKKTSEKEEQDND